MKRMYVIFHVADAVYALAAEDVLVLETFTGATRVPGTAAHVAGLIQVRGAVVPVVDLRRRFHLAELAPTLDTRVVVVQAGGRRVGFLVDSAREVARLEDDSFRNPPEVIDPDAAGFVKAVAQVEGRLIMLIDPLRVIGEEQAHGE